MKTLLIDTSYLIYRSYFAYPDLSVGEQPVGALFGFCKAVLSLKKEYQPDRIAFTCDTPKPTWRHKILKDYKAGRPEIEDKMKSQIPLIYDWCQSVTDNYYIYPGYEADDIIFTLTNQLLLPAYVKDDESIPSGSELFNKDNSSPEFPVAIVQNQKKKEIKSEEVLIFSSDRDLYQLLVYPEVTFIKNNSFKQKLETFRQINFKEKYSLDTIQWLDYKAIVGDSSDNLKGVPGIGPKTAVKILSEVGGLYNLFNSLNLPIEEFAHCSYYEKYKDTAKVYLSDSKNHNLLSKITQNQDQILQTYKLSKLQFIPKLDKVSESFDLQKGSLIFEKYRFTSLLKDLEKDKASNLQAEALF